MPACPISCGQCCDYWRDVLELVMAAPDDAVVCPHETAEGCALPRGHRPADCEAYLCEVAQAVLEGVIPREEGVELKAQCCLFLPEDVRLAASK